VAEGPFAEVEALLQAGRVKEAANALRRSAGRGGCSWEAMLWLGRIEERRGRRAQAERAFRRAVSADPKAAPELARLLEEEAGARIEALLHLVDAGQYAPDLERALLAAVARAGAGDKLAGEWPQIFSALMCAGRYREAFRLGEAVLDRFGRLDSPGQLMWPWWRRIRRAVAEDRFIEEELGRIREAAKSGDFRHWFAYYRAILMSDGSRHQGRAMLEYRRIRTLDGERYSWMLQSFVLVKLGVLDYAGAIEISRDILRRCPAHWWVRCRMAEAYMAAGDTAQGLREFEKAERTCGPGLRGEVLTWHGEVLLWLGDYARALEKLDAAVALGALTFVFGWRGAVRLKLGDHDGALADLDRAVALDPKDFEARGWRAEAYRIRGRGAEALRDIDYLVAHGPRNYWTHFNRALLRDALGDGKGMAEDLAEAPAEMLALVKRKLGLPRGGKRLTRGEMRSVLTSLLDWSNGIRRWERYVQPIWMERLP
jgi:tetratricopeptide (TPR) repeat protein